ncbi:MAG: FolC bifunctional protein [Chthoniobacteraceae bacterium]|nr:FolC bifunctional protein [Chthoniobacteraceae bacterium]
MDRNFESAVGWLYGMQLHGIKLGLGKIEALVDGLGVHVKGPRAPKFLHVAGTNGKGSVCAMLDSICRAAGLKTGLFISPHLITFRERIRVNGAMISEEEVVSGLQAIREMSADWDQQPTFFEIVTALGLAHFQRHGVDVAVLETGMGGRLDATNVVTPAVSVITPIGFDHTLWLGDSLAAIAGEKAGIIKPGVPVVISPQEPTAETTLREAALRCGAPFYSITAPVTGLEVALEGSHQRWNAAAAIKAVELAGIKASSQAIANGLRNVEWPGRFQHIDDRLVLDGAHNPAAIERLVQTWREVYGEEKATLIVGILKDKDVRGVCRALLPIAARVIVLPVKNERSSDPDDVVKIFREFGVESATESGLAAALAKARARPERMLLTGSLFLIGEALAALSQTIAEKSNQ